jgi:hypothetical protein
MKTVARVMFVMTAFVAALPSANAYQPGPPVIRECPGCRKALIQATTMSGNTFGAKVWTDGRMLAPMLPDRPWLVKCPACRVLFWVDEARELGQREWGRQDTQWPDARAVESPEEADYLGYLSATNLTVEKTIYVRRRAWWAANDPAREKTRLQPAYTPAQETNMLALAELLDEQDPDQCIMKAEIFRELGRFDACIRILSRPFDGERYAQVAAFIKSLAERKSAELHEIKEDVKSEHEP